MLSTLRSSACAFAFLAVLAPLAGCSGKPDADPAPLPDPASCSGAWTTIFAMHTPLPKAPEAITWHDGVIYGSATIDAKDVLFALPEGGGTPRILTEDWAQSMWVEGDRLVYAREDELLSVPLAGGAPVVIVDAQLITKPSEQYVFYQTYDGDALYMVLQSYASDGSNVSRVYRAQKGGPTKALATLPFPKEGENAGGIAIFGDDVIVAGNEGVAFAVPKNGGNLRSLATYDGQVFVGFDDRGPVWRAETGPSSFALTPNEWTGMDQKNRWSTMPSSFAGERMASVDNGAVTFGLESFAGGFRTSVWGLDAASDAPRRLACAPDALGASPTAIASSRDAVFVAVDRDDDTGRRERWEIDRIAR